MSEWALESQSADVAIRSISPLLNDLGENLSIMQKMVNLMGTTADTETERRKFSSMVNESRQTMTQATRLMQRMSSPNQQIENELFEYGKSLRRIVEQFRSKCQKYRPYKKASPIYETDPLLATMNANQFNPQNAAYPYQYPSQTQTNINNQFEDEKILDRRCMTQVTIHNETQMLEENESKMQEIVSTIEDINELFEDLYEMTEDQQGGIEHLQNNVISTKDYTNRAKNELLKGEKHMKKARRNRCMLLFILIVALAALVCIIWAFKKK